MAEEVDRIRIVVEPDTTGFQKDLETDLAKVKADVAVGADTTRADDDVKGWKKKQENAPALEIEVTAELDGAETKYRKFVKTVDGQRVEVSLDATTKQAEAAVAKFQRRAEAIKLAVPVDVDTGKATAEVNAFRAKAEAPITPLVSPVVSPAALAKTENTLAASARRSGATIGSALSRGIQSAGFVGAAAVGVTLFATLREGVDETLQLSQVTGQLASTYRTLGANVGKSTAATLARSAAIESATGIDEIAIANAERALLVIGKQTPEAVGRATRAAVNLAAATANGADPAVKLASVQNALAKALANPAKAQGVLARSGVVLSQSQKDTIDALVESGKTAEAQGIILTALEKRAQGAANAYGNTLPGQLSRAKDTFSDFSRELASGLLTKALPAFLAQSKTIGSSLSVLGPQIGDALGKAVTAAVPAFIGFIAFLQKNGPEIGKILQGVGSVVSGVFSILKELVGGALATFGDLFSALSDGEGDALTFGDALKDIGKSLKQFAGFLKENEQAAKVLGTVLVGGVVAAFVALAGPVSLAVAAVVAVVSVLGVLYQRVPAVKAAVQEFGRIVGSVFGFVKAQVIAFLPLAQTILLRAIEPFKTFIAAFRLIFRGGFANVIKGVGLLLKGLLQLVTVGIRNFLTLLVAGLKKFGPAVLGFIGRAVVALGALVARGLVAIVQLYFSLPGRIIRAAASLVPLLLSLGTRALTAFKNAVVTGINVVLGFVRRLPGRIVAAAGSVTRLLYKKGEQVITGLLDGIKAGFEKVKKFVGGIAETIKSLKGPIEVDRTLLVDEGKAIMQGFQRGLEQRWKGVADYLSGRGDEIEGSLSADAAGKLEADLGAVIAGEVSPGGLSSIIRFLEDNLNFGLHPTTGTADTTAMANKIAARFGLAISSIFRAYDTVAGPGVSQHTLGEAADFVGTFDALDRAASAMSKLIDKIFKQVIWRDSLWRNGSKTGQYIADHYDHMHLGWVRARRNGGRVSESGMYEVNEGGRRELFVPDTSGFVMSHADVNRMMGLTRRVSEIEAASSRGANVSVVQPKQTVQNFETKVELTHAVNDPGSLLAVLNANLGSAMRNIALQGGMA